MRSFLFSLLFIMKLHSWVSMGHYIFKIVNFRSSSFILDKFDGELRELYMQLYIEELFFSKQFKELVQVNVCTVYCVLYYLIYQFRQNIKNTDQAWKSTYQVKWVCILYTVQYTLHNCVVIYNGLGIP